MHAHAGRWLFLAVLLFCGGGADCTRQLWIRPNLPPPALPPQPTLDDIVSVVNRNTSLVQTVSAPQASLSGPGFPNLRANLYVEKPRRLRLLASFALSGRELDMGSNNELFWLWLKRSQPPATYYCTHEQFAGSEMRRMIPVQPEQFIEALGLVTFDPQAQHEGPRVVGTNRLEIRSRINGPEGQLTKTTIVDQRMGWVLEQHLHDAQNRHIATVRTSGHRQDPLSGAYLPRTIEFQWPMASMQFTLDIDQLVVNQPIAPDLWVKPEEPNYPNVNLAEVMLRGQVAAGR